MSNTVVNTNVSALNAYRGVKNVGTMQAKASEKLSTGERINRAADDAAGLAISEKMRAQIRGLDKSVANIQDGVNLAKVTEGGLQEVGEMIHRMRELTVQAANDTNTDTDRENIQIEIDELADEIDSMSERVQFNNINVLDCPPSVVLNDDSQTIGPNSNTVNSTYNDPWESSSPTPYPKGTPTYNTVNTDPNSPYLSSSSSFNYSESEENLGSVSEISSPYPYDNPLGPDDAEWKDYYHEYSEFETVVVDVTDNVEIQEKLENIGSPTLDNPSVLSNGKPSFDATTPLGDNINLSGNNTNATLEINGKTIDLYSLSSTQSGSNPVINTFTSIDGIQITQSVSMNASGYEIDFSFENTSGGDVIFDFEFSMDAYSSNSDADITLTGNGTPSGNSFSWSGNPIASGAVSSGNVDYDVTLKNDYYVFSTRDMHDIDTTTTTTTDIVDKVSIPHQLGIQNGANSGQLTPIRILDVDCVNLGLFFTDSSGIKTSGVNVLTHEDCNQSLEILDRVLNKVNSYRGYYGAKINTMEHTVQANEVTELNLSASESRIRDTDMAKEMMNLTKANVLQQASTNMLAQANQQPNNVLQLLGEQ